ncbi:unnamed protein product [Durusdinium trenchii]|uniref:Uncharacterized protein n=1 Tax=Durusdinium trenchii TaxID=1381693 RepID=A0ABP0JVL4_9DINO
MVCLDSTLGAKQGTLYRAPRAAELKATDDNAWARSDYWQLMTCKPSPPLSVSHLTIRWHSFVLYEMMDELSKECYLCGFSETTNPVVHTYACTQIKDKLIEDWKSGSGCIGSWTPRFNPEPDQSTNLQPQVPTMKVCKVENDVPVIPKEVRERWLNDPVRNPDWRVRLKNFDAVFAAPSDPGTSAPRPRPDPSAQDVDLGADKPTPPQEGGSATTDSHAPASMTVEAFKQKFPTVTATVAINLGQTVTAYLVENQVYIMCAVKHRIVGAESREAKCIFPYGGGQWISDGAKAGTLAKVD